jgi:hypothetical protein
MCICWLVNTWYTANTDASLQMWTFFVTGRIPLVTVIANFTVKLCVYSLICLRVYWHRRFMWENIFEALRFYRCVLQLEVQNWFIVQYTKYSPFYGPTAPRGPVPYYRLFTIALRHTTLGRTPLDEWSARCRELWQHTPFTKCRLPCPRRDSNSQYQQACGRRPTP